MSIVQGQEFHSIIQNIFEDVKGLNTSEQLQVCCPRCQEREGLPYPDGKFNLEINTKRKLYRCWKCEDPKFSGSLGKLIRLYGSHIDYEIYKSYVGSIQDYVFEEDVNIQVRLPDEMIYFSQMESNNLEHFEAYNYLVNERKISRDIILKYRLGFCTTGKYKKRIIIPSFDMDGGVNYFVGRNYGSKSVNGVKISPYLNPKADKDKIIFNEGLINWDSTIYLVEGTFDMLSFPVNSVPMLGKTISSTLFSKLNELKPDIVVLLDPDAYKNSIDLYYTLYTIYVGCEEKVKLVKLPTNEDIDELRKNKGIEEVIKSLYNARGLTVEDYFIKKLHKPYDERTRRYNSNSKYFEWKSNSGKNTI